MMYLLAAMAVITLITGGFAGCEHKRAGSLKDQVEAQEKVIADWKEHSRVLTESIDNLEKDTKRRVAAAKQAMAEQETLRVKSDAEVVRLQGEKRSDPNDPCKSACTALQSPL